MSQLGLVTKEITMSLGYTTHEITMPLGGGDVDLSRLGLITDEITMSLGADNLPLPAAPLQSGNWQMFWAVAAVGSAVVSGAHGYYRGNRSMGTAAGWAMLGLLFPIITPAIALAQGFAQPSTR